MEMGNALIVIATITLTNIAIFVGLMIAIDRNEDHLKAIRRKLEGEKR